MPFTSQPKNYDQKCADLARHFLTDETEGFSPAEVEVLVDRLANEIQDVAEGFLAFEKNRLKRA